jgi:rare lipoprotein A
VAACLLLVCLVVACGGTQKRSGTGTGTGTGTGARDVQVGLATWYATGTMTASGERFDKNAMTAAHRKLPFGSVVRVTHRKTHKSVTVRINDRGPYGRAMIDLSKAAAKKLGIIDEGVAPVRLEVLSRPAKKPKKPKR